SHTTLANSRDRRRGLSTGLSMPTLKKRRPRAPARKKCDFFSRRRKANSVGKQIKQDLTQTPLVGGEAADVGRSPNVEPDTILDQPILDAFRRRFHAGTDVDIAQV